METEKKTIVSRVTLKVENTDGTYTQQTNWIVPLEVGQKLLHVLSFHEVENGGTIETVRNYLEAKKESIAYFEELDKDFNELKQAGKNVKGVTRDQFLMWLDELIAEYDKKIQTSASAILYNGHKSELVTVRRYYLSFKNEAPAQPKVYSKDNMSDRAQELMKDVIFFVEATSFEKQSLWYQYKEGYDWVHESTGFLFVVGEIVGDTDRPVSLEFSFAEIMGYRICFWECSSRYCDHDMIKQWFDENYPLMWCGNSRRAHANAMNFASAIDAVHEHKQNKERSKSKTL